MNLPFRIAEAQKLCKEFQYLVGTSFNSQNTVIESIVVTPYDTGHKQRFFAFYLLYENDADMALSEYTGNLFDITVIASNPEGHWVNESLMVWASKHNIFVNRANNIAGQSAAAQAYLQ